MSAGESTQEPLSSFPRPSVAVDVAVCSVVPGPQGLALAVLLIRRETGTHHGRWSLPGSFVRERERLADAVERTLADKAGVRGLAPRQLAVLDDPARDDRGWVLSVAHVDSVPMARADQVGADDRVTWAPVVSRHGEGGREAARGAVAVPGRWRSLPFDHDRIVSLAVDDLRRRYDERPDPAGFLTGPFTIRELRLVHEAVLGRPLQKDTFRRQVLPHLEQLDDEAVPSGPGRPALRFRTA